MHRLLWVPLIAILASAPAFAAPKGAPTLPKRFSGNVSWYGVPFHGRKTASGRIFDMNKLSSAHKTLPFYTKVLVENPRNGKTVIVQVLDRGPFVANRVMDLSREAARQLGTLLGGVAWVDCIVVDERPAASPKSPAEPVQSDSKADPEQSESEKPSSSAP